MAKTWAPVTQHDLIDFISILFLASVQKRKDKPSHWFSNNPFLEMPVAKKTTSSQNSLQFSVSFIAVHTSPKQLATIMILHRKWQS